MLCRYTAYMYGMKCIELIGDLLMFTYEFEYKIVYTYVTVKTRNQLIYEFPS